MIATVSSPEGAEGHIIRFVVSERGTRVQKTHEEACVTDRGSQFCRPLILARLSWVCFLVKYPSSMELKYSHTLRSDMDGGIMRGIAKQISISSERCLSLHAFGAKFVEEKPSRRSGADLISVLNIV